LSSLEYGNCRDPCANANAVFGKSQLKVNFEKKKVILPVLLARDTIMLQHLISHFCSFICHVVTYRRLKKGNFQTLALKVAVAAFERWSLTVHGVPSFHWETFGMLEIWLLRRGSCNQRFNCTHNLWYCNSVPRIFVHHSRYNNQGICNSEQPSQLTVILTHASDISDKVFVM